MVRNPYSSQKILVWGIETALSLLFQAFGKLDEKISRLQISDHLYNQVKDSGISRNQISKTVYELKRHKYLEVFEGDSVKLTNKARIKLIDQVCTEQSADGKFRLVSFDIPEAKRANRDNFRRAIKRMGFRQVQKSLWVANRNVGELVEAAANEYGVNDYVAYFVADKSNIDSHISHVLDHKNSSDPSKDQ